MDKKGLDNKGLSLAKKRILFLSGSYGAGHMSVAKALIRQMKIDRKNYDYEIFDTIKEINSFIHAILKLYGPITITMPKLYRDIYLYSNNKKRWEKTSRFIEKAIERKLKKKIISFRPDCFICTYSLSTIPILDVLEDMGFVGKGKNRIPFICPLADPINPPIVSFDPRIDLVLAASKEAEKIALEHMPREKVKLAGFAVDPKFFPMISGKKKDRLREKLGLKKDLFTILLSGGSEGQGEMLKIVSFLDRSKLPIQMVVICGRNKLMKAALDAVIFKTDVKVCGFVHNMEELLSASDVLICKSGASTIMESITKELPMIIFDFIYGQESGHPEFIEREGLGYYERKPKTIVAILDKMINDPGSIPRLKKNLQKARKKMITTEKIAKIIEGYVDGKISI